MRGHIINNIKSSHGVDSTIPKHTKFSTKQKAKINRCLEEINELVFECYDQPEKVYKLRDIYNVIIRMVEDGTAYDIDNAISIFEERMK